MGGLVRIHSDWYLMLISTLGKLGGPPAVCRMQELSLWLCFVSSELVIFINQFRYSTCNESKDFEYLQQGFVISFT